MTHAEGRGQYHPRERVDPRVDQGRLVPDPPAHAGGTDFINHEEVVGRRWLWSALDKDPAAS